MQFIGYITPTDETFLLLVRTHKVGVSLKIREGGTLGRWMEDEELFLRERPDLVEQLRKGEVIKL